MRTLLRLQSELSYLKTDTHEWIACIKRYYNALSQAKAAWLPMSALENAYFQEVQGINFSELTDEISSMYEHRENLEPAQKRQLDQIIRLYITARDITGPN